MSDPAPPLALDTHADTALAELFEEARAALLAPTLELNPHDRAHACAMGALEVLRLARANEGQIVDDATAIRTTADLLGELARYARSAARDVA